MSIQHPAAPGDAAKQSAAPVRVIFVCTGNSARSQMAEALLRRDGGDRVEVVSAGVSPRGIHPMTIKALEKVGIDISGARSKPVAEFLGQRFDYVITVCDRARATCPVFPGGSETLHWGIDGPDEILRAVPGLRLLAWVSPFDSPTFADVSLPFRVISLPFVVRVK